MDLQHIRNIMQKKGLSGPKLAKKMNCSYRTLDEALRRGNCRVSLLVEMAVALDIPICELIHDSQLKKCEVKNTSSKENQTLKLNKVCNNTFTIIEILKDCINELNLSNLVMTNFSIKNTIKSETNQFTQIIDISFKDIDFEIKISEEKININFNKKKEINSHRTLTICKIADIDENSLAIIIENNEVKTTFTYNGDTFENITSFKITTPAELLNKNKNIKEIKIK